MARFQGSLNPTVVTPSAAKIGVYAFCDLEFRCVLMSAPDLPQNSLQPTVFARVGP